MKTRVTALLLLTVVLLSCSKENGGRRPEPKPEPDTPGLVDNPNWTITYKGREVDTKDGVYVVDPIYVQASDKVPYYVDLISLSDYKSVYQSNPRKYAEGSFKNFVSDYVVSGDSRTAFDALDAGDGDWVAIAYEISDGKIGSKYSLLKFKTQAVKMRKDESYQLSYDGRKEIDGDECDIISVKSFSNYTYYVDIAYPDYINENYNGSPVGFFNDVLDGVAAQLKDGEDFQAYIEDGESSIAFDRLRHGDWTAYAFGTDYLGNLTGNWSELNFDIEEEEPEEEFSKWLGIWAIGSDNLYYNITVSSAEANIAYSIQDWEVGKDASDWANQNCRGYIFEAAYNRKSKDLVFNSQYLGTLEDDELGTFDVCFLGNILCEGQSYSITDIDIPLATASTSDGAKTATVNPERVTAKIDGSNYNTSFTSMQLMDVTDKDIYVYNETVPSLPMTMTKIAEASPAKTVAARRLPSRKLVSTGHVTATKSFSSASRRSVNGITVLRNSAPQRQSVTKAPSSRRGSIIRNSGKTR